MPLKQNYQLMADYNQWMNQSIYQSAAQLSTDDLTKDRGAFFNSILGTLDHIIVGDTIWLKRFADHLNHFASLNYIRDLDFSLSLDTVFYPDFSALKQEREKYDRLIINFIDELDEATIEEPIRYQNLKGDMFSKNLGHLLLHFFNHQTHHRGQVSTLMSQVGIDIGVTDLVVSLPDQ